MSGQLAVALSLTAVAVPAVLGAALVLRRVVISRRGVAAELEPLDWVGQMAAFVALFYMFGKKVGALKYTTGIA